LLDLSIDLSIGVDSDFNSLDAALLLNSKKQANGTNVFGKLQQ